MNKLKKILTLVMIGILVVGILIVCGILLGKKDNASNPSYDVKQVMTDNTSITIDDVEDSNANITMANVTITTPDLVAIYKKMNDGTQSDGLSMEDVCCAVSKHAKDPDCIIKHNVTAEVQKEGDNWVLVSDERIQSIIMDMVDQLLVQMLNDEESFEIESIDIGGMAK